MIDSNTGEVIKIFDSQSDAAREMNISRKGITKACIGKSTVHYKGYIWEYADKEYVKPIHCGVGNYNHVNQRKKVRMIDTDGKEYFYESISQAGEILGIRPNTISRYLLGIRVDSSGRRWCYA